MISETTNIAVYLGNGVTTVFPFSFHIEEEDHLHVYEYVIATGVLTEINAANYTVTGVPGTGSVTYNPAGVPVPATKRVVLMRIVPLEQPLDIQNQGGFHPDSFEDQLDLMVMQTQQLARGALQLGPGADDPEDGDILAWSDGYMKPSGAGVLTLNTEAAMAVNVRVFGAVGDGVADDTTAIQEALDYALLRGLDVLFPAGTYLVTSSLTITGISGSKPFKLVGVNGQTTSRIVFSNAVNLANLFTIGEDTSYFQAEHLEFLDGASGTARTSRCFYFRDNDDFATAPSWKHFFQDCRFFGFKEGIRFDGGATIADDTHLAEVMFLHCKFRNNMTGLVYNNIQAVNHHLIGTDFENDHADDVTGKWVHIKLERGTVINHVGGSVIGYGPYLQFTYAIAGGFQNTSQFVSRGVRLEARGDGPFIYQHTDSTITLSNAIRLNFDNLIVLCSNHSDPKLARFGGRVYAKFQNCHANANVDVQAYVTSNLISNLEYGFIDILDCKQILYERISDVAAYGGTGITASNFQSIPAEISHKFEAAQFATAGGVSSMHAHRQTVYSGAFQIAQPKTFVIAKSSTAGLLSGTDPASMTIQLPLHARPFRFRLLRDDVNAGSAFVLTLYAIVAAVDYSVAVIIPTSGVGGHFEENIQAATGLTYFLRNDVDWDGQMKITKSGTTNGFVGLIMIDYM